MGFERESRHAACIGATVRRVAAALAGRSPGSSDPEYDAWLALHTPSARELATQSRASAALSWRPMVDAIVLRRVGDDGAVARTRLSLAAQTYRRFTVTDAAPHGLEEVLARTAGDLVLLVEAGDAMAPQALYELAAAGDDAEVLYFDEDRLAVTGREDPWFKPGWSPEELASHDYLGRACAVRRDLIAGAGTDLDGALARVAVGARRARHIPDVLLHRRADAPRPEGRIAAASSSAGAARVAAVIPTKNAADLLDACVRSLDEYRCRAELELLVVDNASTDEDALAVLRGLRRRPGCRVLSWNRPFNWSAVNNLAARETGAEHLLFLNNDVEATCDGWLDALVRFAARPEIGLVGAQLVYPDDTIQHGGVVMGMTGFAGHLFQGCLRSARTRFGPTHVVRNCSSVTGACMLVRREVFHRLGGFDERLQLCGSDVALGLGAMSLGLRNVVEPQARLIHHESRTRGTAVPRSDYRVSLEIYEPWLRAGDPFYNPNLSLRDGTCRLRVGPEDMLARARRIAG